MNAGGSISWAAFLRMGALRENSPNKNLRPSWNQPKIPVPLHQLSYFHTLFVHICIICTYHLFRYHI